MAGILGKLRRCRNIREAKGDRARREIRIDEKHLSKPRCYFADIGDKPTLWKGKKKRRR